MAIADYLRKLVELRNQLVANLKSMGVTADESEKLNTLVPKVLECGTKQNVEWVESPSGSLRFGLFKNIIIPDGVSSFSREFNGSECLESIYLPDSITSGGDGAFYGCTSLKNVRLSPNLTNFKTYSVNSTVQGFFENCTSLTDIIIPDGVTTLGDRAFRNCTSLKSVTIPGSITSIGINVFADCTSLENVTFGRMTTIAGQNMFRDCTNLKNITIPDGVITLGSADNSTQSMFPGSGLESIIIPDSVTTLGWYVLSETNELAHIYYKGSQTQWNAITKCSWWNNKMGSNVSGGTKIHYNYIDTPYNVYGVIWDGSSSTKLTRTNDSEKFSNPVPALGGTGGSSPFDSCYPWSEIERVTIDGNELVKIPKFWYRIVKHNNELSFQIADGPVEGFNVSPAHADRGDGKGERDYVYIGRYQCTSSNYKSVTNTAVMTNITRATARSGITSLGTGYYMKDFALYWTIRMLYLVEFADWDSQKVIGYGCGDGIGPVNTGTTDNMSYHTGTMHSTRDTYGTGIQYRWIEDPWANAYDWCDGIRFSGSDIYVYNNPSEYSDTTGGIKIGTRPTTSGYITQWSVPSVSGYDWALYPSTVKTGTEATHVADMCFYVSSGVELCVGGSYGQRDTYGAFFLNGNCTESESWGDIGARLQYLP